MAGQQNRQTNTGGQTHRQTDNELAGQNAASVFVEEMRGNMQTGAAFQLLRFLVSEVSEVPRTPRLRAGRPPTLQPLQERQ